MTARRSAAFWYVITLGLVVGGCAAEPSTSPAAAAADPAPAVVARVNGRDVPRGALLTPLLRGYGPVVLEDLVLLEVVRQHAATRGLTLTSRDRAAELERVLQDMAPGRSRGEQLNLLRYMLRSRGMARAHFDLVLDKQALLRRLVADEVHVDDQAVQVEYQRNFGPRAVIRLLAVSELRRAEQARQHLQSGADFAALIDEFSEDQATLGRGGELGPFSAADVDVPEAIRQASFTLEPGQVSDIVFYRDAEQRPWWALLRVETLEPGSTVPLAEVRADMEQAARRRAVQAAMAELQQRLRQEAQVRILDSDLRRGDDT